MKFTLNNKRGFTLIEVLMVILIISILSVMAVNAYIYARYRGLLNLQTEKIVEALRSSKFEVTRGSIEGGPKCLGYRMITGKSTLEKINADYLDGKCGKIKSLGTAEFALTRPINIAGVKRASIEVEKVDIYFSPPEGEMFVDGKKEEATLIIQFGDNEDDDWRKQISVEPTSNSIAVLPLKE